MFTLAFVHVYQSRNTVVRGMRSLPRLYRLYGHTLEEDSKFNFADMKIVLQRVNSACVSVGTEYTNGGNT